MDLPLEEVDDLARAADLQLELFVGGGGGSGDNPPPGAAARRHLHHYYFTLLPPPNQAQDIERGAMLIARRYGARYPIRASRLHVSLNGVWKSDEDLDTALLDDAMAVGDSIRRPGFDVAFDKLLTFNGDSRSKTGGRTIVPTVLTCANGARDLQALYADIHREMRRLGMPVAKGAFTPHLTLWYGPERVPERLLGRPYRWPVRKFWLVHTIKGQRQPDYLGEWSLG